VCSEEAGLAHVTLVLDPITRRGYDVSIPHAGRGALHRALPDAEYDLRAEFNEICATHLAGEESQWGASECAADMLQQMWVYANECKPALQDEETASEKQDAAPMESYDIQFFIVYPAQGATYYSAKALASEVTPVLEVAVGSGPWADAVRGQPDAFELCITWDATDPSANYTCRPLLNSSPIGPNLNVATAPPGAHTFSVHLQLAGYPRGERHSSTEADNTSASFAELPKSTYPIKRVDYFTAPAWRRGNDGAGAPRSFSIRPQEHCHAATAEGASVECSVR
jgi:hypothetical protein